MSLDLDDLADDIYSKFNQSLETDWQTRSTVQRAQGKRLARQAALLSQLKLCGELQEDDQIFDTLVEQFEDATRNFSQAVANLTILTLQNAWKAIVNALWGAINGLLSNAGLGVLSIPQFGD